MDVTAEGVESEEQAAALESYGCNIAQGFLFSRPVPLRALKLILEDQSMEAFDRRRKDARSAGVDCRASLARQYSAA
jgi:EAL domain-containing protein (putative c-di-GMP-specific phosphodiesterase class I)